MRIQLRYFASLREALGAGETFEWTDPPQPPTLGALRDQLAARGGRHAEAFVRPRPVRCALDQTMCDEAAVVHDGAEVAFFPPVTGG
jgi:molybdopterin synthase sulfur carrier subunit